MRRYWFWKNIAISISLACLALLGVFKQLLFPTGERYFEKELPTLEMGAALVCVGILSIVFLLILSVRDRVSNGRLRLEIDLLFFGLGLLCFAALSSEAIGWMFPMKFQNTHFQLPLIVGGACLLIPRKGMSFLSRAAENLSSLALIAAPLAGILILNVGIQASGLWIGEMGPRQIEMSPTTTRSSKFPKRVVLMIFDELDHESIVNRPDHIKMSSWEELVSKSVVSEKAFPPNNYTQKSIPSLLTGRQVVQARPAGTKELEIKFSLDDKSIRIQDTENIFSDVKAKGGRSGIVGWFHPYVRLFEKEVNAAYWYPDAVSTCFSLSECVLENFAVVFNSLPFSNPFEAKEHLKFEELFSEPRVAGQIERIPQMRQHAVEMAGDDRLDLVYLHFSFPHAPYFDKDVRQTDDYVASFELVDKTISEIREAIDRSGLSERTAIVVSSDHWWRVKTEENFDGDENKLRVPFVVHVGGTRRIEISQAFNTIVTRYLIDAIFRGEITANEDVPAWLTRFAAAHPEIANVRPDVYGQWMIEKSQ